MYVLLLLVMCTQSIQIVDPHRFFMSVQCPRQLVPVLGRGEEDTRDFVPVLISP